MWPHQGVTMWSPWCAQVFQKHSVFETRGDHMVIFDGHMVTPQGGHMAPSRCDHVVARRVAGGDHQPRCLGGSARAAWSPLTRPGSVGLKIIKKSYGSGSGLFLGAYSSQSSSSSRNSGISKRSAAALAAQSSSSRGPPRGGRRRRSA